MKIKEFYETYKKLKTWVQLIPVVLVFGLFLYLLKGTPTDNSKYVADVVQTADVKTNKQPQKQVEKQLISLEPLTKNTEYSEDLFAFSESEVLNAEAKEFIERFINTAIVEKHKYKIPISITLAQGILESNYGRSRLAKDHNNFFGIKCKEKCKNCDGKGVSMTDNCVNFEDDAKDDYFRRFGSAWESFRGRSIFLTSKPRYASLFELDPNDYHGWCVGLKRCGYATNPRYDKILLNLIHKLELHKFDKLPVEEIARQRGIYDKLEHSEPKLNHIPSLRTLLN